MLGEAEAWVRGDQARGGLIRQRGQEGAALPIGGSHARATSNSVQGRCVSRSLISSQCTATQPYLCLEKSCGRSRGPSGTLALPRNAAVLVAGGGRAADIAFEALVLRSRLPWSLVFWNLRTRSSAGDKVSIATAHVSITSHPVPDEPLDSSPEILEPDLTGTGTGTFVDSMARVPVRGCVDMISTTAAIHSYSSSTDTAASDIPVCTLPSKRGDNLQASSLGSGRDYC
jgi:hypothetical protein